MNIDENMTHSLKKRKNIFSMMNVLEFLCHTLPIEELALKQLARKGRPLFRILLQLNGKWTLKSNKPIVLTCWCFVILQFRA